MILEVVLAAASGAAVLGGYGGVIWTFWRSSDHQRIRRLMRKAPTKRIGELGDGELARIVGRARSTGDWLEAPLTGRRCVYWVVTVEEDRSLTRSGTWKTIINEARAVEFALEDDTGRALVDPRSACISIDFDGKSQSGAFDDPTPAETAFLARHDQEGRGAVLNRSLRYREAVIEDGEAIALLGGGAREPDPDAAPVEAYRGEARTLLRLTSTPKFQLIISDDPAVLR